MSGWAAKNKATLVRKLMDLGIPASLEESKGELLLKLRAKVEEAHPVNPPSAEILTFGQYAGKTRQWVWENDRGYLDWAIVTMFEQKKCAKQISDLAKWTLLQEEKERETQGYAQSERPARPAAKRAPTERHGRWGGASRAPARNRNRTGPRWQRRRSS